MKDPYKKIRAYRVGWLLAFTDWITILPVLKLFERKTTTGVRLAYLGDCKQIERDIRHGACFLTNHRDICMDSAWLSMLLRMRYFIRPYIGIGNNLFAKWWIEPVVRFLRCFVVIRNGSLHEQVENATTLSHYINDLRRHGKSIWLAQREGRAKDSNDLTQPGVLKMLTFDAPDFFEAVKTLNICPVSITYEYDPCDYLKAREMQQKRDNPRWRKSKADDLRSMQTGIHGFKGRVTYRLTPSINPEIDQLLQADPDISAKTRNEQIQAVCDIIDRRIHAGYEIYPHDAAFDQYIESRLDLIKLSNKDEAFLREKLYEMYNNPVKNYEKSHLPG
ncbi:MAG: acyltransferase [Paludibacteraceae bacterium]